MTNCMDVSYTEDMVAKSSKPITVRVDPAALHRIMRTRRLRTQSEAINTLIAEEGERLRAWAALDATVEIARRGDFDDRLL